MHSAETALTPRGRLDLRGATPENRNIKQAVVMKPRLQLRIRKRQNSRWEKGSLMWVAWAMSLECFLTVAPSVGALSLGPQDVSRWQCCGANAVTLEYSFSWGGDPNYEKIFVATVTLLLL